MVRENPGAFEHPVFCGNAIFPIPFWDQWPLWTKQDTRKALVLHDQGNHFLKIYVTSCGFKWPFHNLWSWVFKTSLPPFWNEYPSPGHQVGFLLSSQCENGQKRRVKHDWRHPKISPHNLGTICKLYHNAAHLFDQPISCHAKLESHPPSDDKNNSVKCKRTKFEPDVFFFWMWVLTVFFLGGGGRVILWHTTSHATRAGATEGPPGTLRSCDAKCLQSADVQGNLITLAFEGVTGVNDTIDFNGTRPPAITDLSSSLFILIKEIVSEGAQYRGGLNPNGINYTGISYAPVWEQNHFHAVLFSESTRKHKHKQLSHGLN